MNEQSETLQRAMAALSAICKMDHPISPDAEPSPTDMLETLRKPQRVGPDAWREAFRLWRLSEAKDDRREGYGNLVSPYYIDFSEWLAGRGLQPGKGCKRATFERMLRELGFSIANGQIPE